MNSGVPVTNKRGKREMKYSDNCCNNIKDILSLSNPVRRTCQTSSVQ